MLYSARKGAKRNGLDHNGLKDVSSCVYMHGPVTAVLGVPSYRHVGSVGVVAGGLAAAGPWDLLSLFRDRNDEGLLVDFAPVRDVVLPVVVRAKGNILHRWRWWPTARRFGFEPQIVLGEILSPQNSPTALIIDPSALGGRCQRPPCGQNFPNLPRAGIVRIGPITWHI